MFASNEFIQCRVGLMRASSYSTLSVSRLLLSVVMGLFCLGSVASFGVQSNGGGGKERVLLKRAQSEFIQLHEVSHKHPLACIYIASLLLLLKHVY